jgi:hypothetical protein
MRIWVFIHAAFHSVDKNSTKVIKRGYRQIARISFTRRKRIAHHANPASSKLISDTTLLALYRKAEKRN